MTGGLLHNTENNYKFLLIYVMWTVFMFAIFQMIQAIQVLRFHLLELEKVNILYLYF